MKLIARRRNEPWIFDQPRLPSHSTVGVSLSLSSFLNKSLDCCSSLPSHKPSPLKKSTLKEPGYLPLLEKNPRFPLVKKSQLSTKIDHPGHPRLPDKSEVGENRGEDWGDCTRHKDREWQQAKEEWEKHFWFFLLWSLPHFSSSLYLKYEIFFLRRTSTAVFDTALLGLVDF